MNGTFAADILLDRAEPRRDGRAGADAMASLFQGEAFARVLDATLETRTGPPTAAENRAEDRQADTAVRRDEPRAPLRSDGRERPEAGADRPAAASSRERAETRTEKNAVEEADAAESGADAEAETDAGDADGEHAADDGADAMKDLLKLMSPTALRTFQAAAGGAAEAAAGLSGAQGAARLPAGMRPLLMQESAAAAASQAQPEPPVPPARVASQVLQALSRAEGLGEGRGTVRLALDPAHLGKVEITLTRNDGRLDVTFRVESSEAEHALRSRAGELGQALLGKSSGWRDVNVTVTRENEENAADQEQTGDRSGRHAHDDEDPAADDTREEQA